MQTGNCVRKKFEDEIIGISITEIKFKYISNKSYM